MIDSDDDDELDCSVTQRPAIKELEDYRNLKISYDRDSLNWRKNKFVGNETKYSTVSLLAEKYSSIAATIFPCSSIHRVEESKFPPSPIHCGNSDKNLGFNDSYEHNRVLKFNKIFKFKLGRLVGFNGRAEESVRTKSRVCQVENKEVFVKRCFWDFKVGSSFKICQL